MTSDEFKNVWIKFVVVVSAVILAAMLVGSVTDTSENRLEYCQDKWRGHEVNVSNSAVNGWECIVNMDGKWYPASNIFVKN